MGKYGDTAVHTTELLREGCESAQEAWRAIVEDVFPDAPEARDKACPREAFLGLCAAGLIRGVSPNTCTEPSRSPNRRYSITAVRLLTSDPNLAHGSKIGLWRRVIKELGMDLKKKPNEQMEVVLALWERGLINTSTAVNHSEVTV
jgi:hypothetical protein